MNIAYVVRRSFPGPGGIATMMRVVAHELQGRHRVRVWAARIDAAPFTRLNTTLGAQSFAPLTVDGVRIEPIPMGVPRRVAAAPLALLTVPGFRGAGFATTRKATSPAYVRSVGAVLARRFADQDVVHCWGGEHVNWAAGDAARRAGTPLVVTPFAHPGAWGDDEMNAAFYRSADAVCALLPTEAAFYSSIGVAEDRLHVVGVPVTPQPSGGPDVRAAHAIGDAPLVLFLGVKEPYKGYRVLLDATATIWREHPDTRFVFVGPRTAASERDFARLDDARIIEVGLVPHEEVAAWLRAATMLCLPSTSEIMPVSILEAWSEGVPVVAAEWWCARDLIDDGGTGLIKDATAASIAEGVAQLLADPAAARAMGLAGKQVVEQRYAPAAVAARHEVAYEAAMASASAKR